MLRTRAYSFRRQARLALSLCWVAGFVNSITFLESAQLFTSHMTGAVTVGGIAAVQGAWDQASVMIEIVLAFLAGAMGSALLTELGRRRAWRSPYAAPVALEAALLGAISVLLELDIGVPRAVVGLAAFAMGLQNATITQISGAVVRSTHVTGVVTDLGVESVQAWFWWRDPARRVRPSGGWRFWAASTWHPRIARLMLLGSILLSFLLGTAMGVVGHALAPRVVLILPIACLVAMVVYSQRAARGEIRVMDPMGEADLRAAGLTVGGLPAGVGVYWLGRSRPVGSHPDYGARHEAYFRAPDFEGWMGRLPPSCRHALLVLSPFVVLDGNAALDLEQVARRMHEGGRRLWLAGLTAEQRDVLELSGVLAVVGHERVFAQVEGALEALRRQLGAEPPTLPQGL